MAIETRIFTVYRCDGCGREWEDDGLCSKSSSFELELWAQDSAKCYGADIWVCSPECFTNAFKFIMKNIADEIAEGSSNV